MTICMPSASSTVLLLYITIYPNLTRIYPKINCLDFCPKAGRDFLFFPKFHQKTWFSHQKCNLWSQNRDFINFITGLSQFNSNLFSFTWRNTLNLTDFIRTLSKNIYPYLFPGEFFFDKQCKIKKHVPYKNDCCQKKIGAKQLKKWHLKEMIVAKQIWTKQRRIKKMRLIKMTVAKKIGAKQLKIKHGTL